MDNADLIQSQATGAPPTSPDPMTSAKQMATAAGGAIKQEAASLASAAQDKVQDQVEQQKKTAGEAIGAFAAAIQHAGEELANNDQSMVGHVVKQAADHLGDLAHSVSDKRPDELLQSMRDFSRRSPGAFAVCSILAGFAIGRLVRTSGEPQLGAIGSEGAR